MMHHRPRKRFGQHFLQDDHIIQEMIETLSLQQTNHVVEIGPGQGALTKFLVDATQTLDIIEIDIDLAQQLQLMFSNHTELTIHQADVLQFDFRSLYTGKTPLRVIGNLPYNISTPLLFHLFSFLDIIQDMYFMLQKEVVGRLTALPGTRDYGRLSVMTQYHCQTLALFDVPPTAFYPPPKVTSSVVRLIPFVKRPYIANNDSLFSEIVKMSFQHKRKTLHNNLKHYLKAEDFSQLNIDPRRRAETLTVGDFVNISNFIHEKHS